MSTNNQEVVVFVRIAVTLVFSLGLLRSTSAADTRITNPETNLADLSSSDFFKNPELKRCHTQYCRALFDVSYAWDLLSHSDTPNSLARLKPLPDSFFKDSERHAARLVSDLNNTAAVCLVEHKMINELIIPNNYHLGLLELMELVSELPIGSRECRRNIVASMPTKPSMTEWLNQADDFIRRKASDDATLRQMIHLPSAKP